MYDPVTLDQLRALVTVVEEGSFSAAARKLKRVQSAVSTAMANLETQLGVTVWDRSTKIAKLTAEGQAVLASARRVLGEVDGLKRLTAEMTMGVEAKVSLCLDALFPLDALVALCIGFARKFPSVDLRIDSQVMSAVSTRVLAGEATLGVVSPLGLVPGLERIGLASIRMVPVVAKTHPLAAIRGKVSTRTLESATQIVLSERSDTRVADQAVLSTRTWRVADLHTKHTLLRAGLGWGNLPEHLVRDDLRSGVLVALRPTAWSEGEHTLHLTAIHKPETKFGPAHVWLLQELETLCAANAKPPRRRLTKRAADPRNRG